MARQIGAAFGLPVHHLDDVARDVASGRSRSQAERLEIVASIAAAPQWVTDGVQTSWTDELCGRADLIIWLDQLASSQAQLRIAQRFALHAMLEFRRQRGRHRFLRVRSYLHHTLAFFRSLREIRAFDHATPSDQAVDGGSRAATTAQLQRYRSKVVHCRTAADVDALLSGIESARHALPGDPPGGAVGRRVIPAGLGSPTFGSAPVGSRGRLLGHLSDPLFRHAYTLILSTGLTGMLGIVYWVLVARLFRSAEVGVNAGVISSIVFLSGLAQLNLRPTLSRFIPVAGRQSTRLALGAYASALFVGGIAATVFLAGSSLWAQSGPIQTVRDQPILATLFILSTMTWTIFALQDGLLVALRATGWLTIENVIFGIAKLLVVGLLAAGAVGGGYAITASWLLPMLIAVALVSVLLFGRLLPAHMRRAPATDPLVSAPRIARFAAADYLGSLFALTYVALLPVIVIDQVGAVAGGQFYIVWVVATALELIPPQMISSLTVDTAADPTTFGPQARRMLIAMFRLLLPVCLVSVVFAENILSVFGPTYQAAVPLLRLLVIAIIPYSLNTLYLALARSMVRTRRIIAVQAALAGIILTLTLVLIGPFGLDGVGLAFLIGHSVVAAVLLMTSLRPVLMNGSVGRSGHPPSGPPDLTQA